MTTSSSEGRQKEFKTDLGRLIQLFGDHLYADADVFVRELAQNAHDSIRRRGEGVAGEIRILADRGAGTVVFTDNGVGMTETDIEQYLSTIGGSGTHATREQLLQGHPEEARQLIGQFGIGILSAFIVAQEVVVETCSSSSPTGLRWTARGGPRYQIETIDKTEVGTTVRLVLKEEYLGLSRPDTLVAAVRRYCDFLPYPISVNGVQANTMHAPWHRTYPSADERTKVFERWVGERFADVPLEVIPVALSEPHVEGVLYIADGRVPEVNTAGGVDVYQSRMFVRRADPGLLPRWARFVGGVVDSKDLRLTASRDAVRKDGQHQRVREALGRLIIGHLCTLAVENPHCFRSLLRWHHYLIKGMALKHDDFFEAIADRVPFEVNLEATDDESFQLLTLPEYVARQNVTDAEGRTVVYYVSEAEDGLQFYGLCNAKGLLVINAGLVFDEAFLHRYAERHANALKLECVDVASSEAIFEVLTDAERAPFLDVEHRLAGLLEQAMPDQEIVVRTERFLPAEIPGVFTHRRDAETRRRLQNLAEHPAFSEAFAGLFVSALGMQGDPIPSVILHLNAACDLIKFLRAESFRHPMVQTTWQLICHNALLYAPSALDARRISRLQSISYEAIRYMTMLYQRFRDLEQHTSSRLIDSLAERPAHTRLLVMLPDGEGASVLEQGLRLTFEDDPYWFEVSTLGGETSGVDSLSGITERAASAHGFIAAVNEPSADVMMQLGAFRAAAVDRPWLVLQREGAPSLPASLNAIACLNYDVSPDGTQASAESVANELRAAVAPLPAVRELLEARALRFLSMTYLERLLGNPPAHLKVIEKLTAAFSTLEEVLEADHVTIIERAGLEDSTAEMVANALSNQT